MPLSFQTQPAGNVRLPTYLQTYVENNSQQVLIWFTIILGALTLFLYIFVPSKMSLVGRLRRYMASTLVTPPSSWELVGTVESLHVYPIKSCRPLPSLTSWPLSPFGFALDRVMMITRSAGVGAPARFMSQRQSPALARLGLTIVEEERDSDGKPTRTVFQLSSDVVPGKKVRVTYPPPPSSLTAATVWSDNVRVVDLGDEAAAFVTLVVDTFENNNSEEPVKSGPPPTSLWGDLRLTCIDPTKHDRTPGPKYMPSVALSDFGTPRPTPLSDGFPFLLTTTTSLDELNARVEENGSAGPLPMSNFRPNIVVKTEAGTAPFDEDKWRTVRIGKTKEGEGVTLSLVKGCPRCKQSCTDQVSGAVSEEPLKTLKTFRAMTGGDGLYFGQNAVAHTEEGTINVGDKIWVVRRGKAGIWDS